MRAHHLLVRDNRRKRIALAEIELRIDELNRAEYIPWEAHKVVWKEIKRLEERQRLITTSIRMNMKKIARSEKHDF